MKKLITLLAILFLTAEIWAQSPANMSYQATVRNSDGELVANQQVGMKISILQGSNTGTAVYSETHNPSANDNGLVTCEIGDGSNVSGSLSGIDWGNGPYFLKIETDPEGGTNYTISGTSQLLSVPYARHAKYAANLTGGISESDPVFSASPAEGISSSDITSWNNKINENMDLVDETWTLNYYWETSSSGTSNIYYEEDHSASNGAHWFMLNELYFHVYDNGTAYTGYLLNDTTIIGTMVASSYMTGRFELNKQTTKNKATKENLGSIDPKGNIIKAKEEKE